jgi:hypothetical protein
MSRRAVGPERASTGHLDLYEQDYETYYAEPRGSRDAFLGPRSSGERLIAPRTSQRPSYRDSLPLRRANDDYAVLPRRTLGSASRLEPIAISSSRRPVSVVPVGSPGRHRPVISSAGGNLSSSISRVRPREDESFYLQPAISSSRRDHARNFSADGGEIGSYLRSSRAQRERERPERAGYRSSGVVASSRGAYNLNVPLVRQPRDEYDRDYGYEYTDPREQMYRDTAPRVRTRRESDSAYRERPSSMVALDSHAPRIVPSSREGGPPPSSRGFERLERDGSIRREYRYPRNSEASVRDSPSRPIEPTGRPRGGPAVALHQDRRGDAYSSDRGAEPHRHSRRAESLERGGLNIRVPPTDRETERLREEEKSRRHSDRRSRDDSQERFSRPELSRKSEHDSGERAERKYRVEPTSRKDRYDDERRDRRDDDHHKTRHGPENIALAAGGTTALSGLFAAGKHRKDHDSSDLDSEVSPRDTNHPRHPDNINAVLDSSDSRRSPDESEEERRARRRRRKEREEKEARDKAREEQERNGTPSKDKKKLTAAEIAAAGMAAGAAAGGALALPDDDSRRGSYHRTKPSLDAGSDETPRRRRHRHHRKTSDRESYSEDSDDDERPDREKRKSEIRVVSPAKEPEPKPKGILRPPREKFPEDPAPVREGVAPLKDAGKKGIPPNARWTKIDRRLVNPEALDVGKERYEERVDYVIVLRVLSKPEIEQYAKLTQELRGKALLPYPLTIKLTNIPTEKRFRDEEARRNRTLALEDADEEPVRALDDRAYNEPQPSESSSRSKSDTIQTQPPESAPVNHPPPLQEVQENKLNNPSRPPTAPQEDSYTREPPNFQYPPPPPPRPPKEPKEQL